MAPCTQTQLGALWISTPSASIQAPPVALGAEAHSTSTRCPYRSGSTRAIERTLTGLLLPPGERLPRKPSPSVGIFLQIQGLRIALLPCLPHTTSPHP